MKSILQETLWKNIPITHKMNFNVSEYNGKSLTLTAPLAENKNDKNTGFAGSIYSLAVLTGWSFLFLKTQEENLWVEIVIGKADVEYLRPVKTDFKAICTLNKSEDLVNLFYKIKKGKKGKINLEINVFDDENHCFSFTGNYYAWLKK